MSDTGHFWRDQAEQAHVQRQQALRRYEQVLETNQKLADALKQISARLADVESNLDDESVIASIQRDRVHEIARDVDHALWGTDREDSQAMPEPDPDPDLIGLMEQDEARSHWVSDREYAVDEPPEEGAVADNSMYANATWNDATESEDASKASEWLDEAERAARRIHDDRARAENEERSVDVLIQEIFRLQEQLDPNTDPGDMNIVIQDDMPMVEVSQLGYDKRTHATGTTVKGALVNLLSDVERELAEWQEANRERLDHEMREEEDEEAQTSHPGGMVYIGKETLDRLLAEREEARQGSQHWYDKFEEMKREAGQHRRSATSLEDERNFLRNEINRMNAQIQNLRRERDRWVQIASEGKE